jgi:hypothetical protein
MTGRGEPGGQLVGDRRDPEQLHDGIVLRVARGRDAISERGR